MMPRLHRAGTLRRFVRWAPAIACLAILTGCDTGGPISVAEAQVSTPYGAAECFLQAQERTRLLQRQIEVLCVGAPNAAGPIDCFLSARRRLRLTDDNAVMLCRCAADTGPYECFERMRRRTDLTLSQIGQLCSPTLSQGLLANCRPIGG